MTPAISVMAMETAAILAGSDKMSTVSDRRPTCDQTMSDPSLNQFSKDYTFEDWED